jgi:hypothetical protein
MRGLLSGLEEWVAELARVPDDRTGDFRYKTLACKRKAGGRHLWKAAA